MRLPEIGLSPDAEARDTRIVLDEGRLMLEVYGSTDGGAVLIDTENTRTYLSDPGTYVVATDGSQQWTQVIVRNGRAEVVDQNGSSIVQAGEEIHIEGTRNPSAEVTSAGALSRFEQRSLEAASRQTEYR